MERPQHELAAFAGKGKKDKSMSLGIVIGVHAVLISGLIVGLSSGKIGGHINQFSISVVPEKLTAPPLPPPPVLMIKAPPTVAPPPPKFEISAAPQPLVPQTAIVAPPLPPPSPAKEIARTHTLPPYPALSQRMGEQGTTALTCDIGADGRPLSCAVTRSSGSQRLDDAASSYVKEHYTWQPATREGKPVADKAQLNVVWDLKNAS